MSLPFSGLGEFNDILILKKLSVPLVFSSLSFIPMMHRIIDELTDIEEDSSSSCRQEERMTKEGR
jgi:hypothetical protein